MNNKYSECNKCMPKSTKYMATKTACNVCKNNTWPDSNNDFNRNDFNRNDFNRNNSNCNDFNRNDFDRSKLNSMMKKSKGITGCMDESMRTSVCRCENGCKKSSACGCGNDYKKTNKCISRNECPLRGDYQNNNNECAPQFACEVDSLPLGIAYVPYQEWNSNVSNACQGLYDGTIFPELVKPFGCTPCYEERRS